MNVAAILAAAALNVATPASVDVRFEPCPPRPSLPGCIMPDTRTIYVHPGLPNKRMTLLHEVGHAYEMETFTDADRLRFRELIGYPPDSTWLYADGEPWSAGERWAQTYAYCARDPQRRPRIWKLAAMYVARRHFATACALAPPG